MEIGLVVTPAIDAVLVVVVVVVARRARHHPKVDGTD